MKLILIEDPILNQLFKLLDKFDGVLPHLSESDILIERGHVIMNVFWFRMIETLKLDRLCIVDYGWEQRVYIGGGTGVLVLI